MSTPEEETLPCPHCDGSKVIEVRASIDPAARLIEECCPACHGTGYQKNNLQPDFMGAPKRKLDQLLADGFRVTGFAIERHAEGAEPVRGFINMGGLVGWWTPGIQAPAKTEEAWAELRAQMDVSNAALFQAQEACKALTAQVEALTKDLADANDSAAWHKRRTSLLQGLQKTMQEPERTIVCDVLANGYLLQGPDGLPDKQRYASQALTRPVYLVATGEVHEGLETYTRHDAPVPLADQEVLFTQPAPQALTRPAVPDVMGEMEAVASTRYKVVASDKSMFHRHAVVAGDGQQQLYLGREMECESMARKFAGAFLDGAFLCQQTMLEPAPQTSRQVLPGGWVPCTVKFEGGYPEDVAYGPQRMMDRLQKWLGKHFAREIRDSLKNAAGEAASPEAYAPLTPDEVRDLTCMQAGAPWADAPLSALAEVIAIYEQLQLEGKRPVDPSTLPEDQVRFPYVATQTAKHPDDQAIDRFAAAMKAKMAEARDKGCYGWEECPPNDLSWMLREHVDKGDPRDVANFCMMLWHLGASIAGPLAKHQPCGCVLCTCQDDGQCHGCGAKHCGTHPVGKFTNPARESCHHTKPSQNGVEA